jgi:hypothetical protein
MPTLAATLKSEIRRITARELKKALKPLQRVARQMKAVRLLARTQRVALSRVQRRLEKVNLRGGVVGRRRRRIDEGPRVAPAAIRLLRRRMKMTRVQFAKAVRVSPGSIFGWETGRSTPRGHSRERLIELKGKLGGARPGRPRGRRARRK